MKFKKEIDDLTNGRVIDQKIKLYNLSVITDEDCLLRVAGRINNATEIRYDPKCPTILDAKDKFTELLIPFYHQRKYVKIIGSWD